jgi:hypothetical protein
MTSSGIKPVTFRIVTWCLNQLLYRPGLVMWDFVMDKSGAGACFLRELRFLLPVYIQYASPQSSSLSSEAGTIGQEWPQCQ